MTKQFDPDRDTIRALTWKEPFAFLMAHGKVETRSWNTNYRGWVLICAGKLQYKQTELLAICGEKQAKRIQDFYAHLPGSSRLFSNLPGKAIYIGPLVDCQPMTRDLENRCYVEYNPLLYCHFYENVQSIIPFPWKGVQGWKELTPLERKQIQIIPPMEREYKQLSLFF